MKPQDFIARRGGSKYRNYDKYYRFCDTLGLIQLPANNGRYKNLNQQALTELEHSNLTETNPSKVHWKLPIL